MCTLALTSWAWIWSASLSARLIGIANAVELPPWSPKPALVAAAVFIPIT